MAYRFSGVVAERAGFKLESYGNGAAYRFQHTESCRDVWIDGDSAAQFRADYDELDAELGGDLHGKDMLAWLWDECGYGDASELMPEIPQ